MIIQNYEILGVIFLLVMMYISFVAYKRKQISQIFLIFWIIIWLGGILALIFKDTIKSLLPGLAIYRVFDLYTIVGFMFFLFMLFYLFRVVKKSEKRIEDLTRMLALNETNENKDNKKK